MNIAKHNTEYIFFIVFFFIYCIKSLLFSLALEEDTFLSILKIGLNFLLLIFSFLSYFFLESKKGKFLFIIFILIALSNIALGNKSYFNYIITIALITLMTHLNWKQVIESLFFIYICTTGILLLLYPLVEYHYLIDDRFGARFTAGFANPNTLSLYLLMLYSISMLYFETLKVSKSILLFISIIIYSLSCGLIYLSYSRTGMALISLFFIFQVLTLLFKNSRIRLRRKYFFTIFLFLVCFISFFQIYSAIYFQNSSFLKTINQLISGRIWHAYNLYQQVGPPSIFGQNIESYLPLDFYFINIIYGIGFLPVLILSYITLKRIQVLKTTLFMAVSLLLFTLLTITESYFSVLFYSPALAIIFQKQSMS